MNPAWYIPEFGSLRQDGRDSELQEVTNILNTVSRKKSDVESKVGAPSGSRMNHFLSEEVMEEMITGLFMLSMLLVTLTLKTLERGFFTL